MTDYQSQFLSNGLETLQAEANLFFDVIIIGSGYGGATAAAELAGRVNADGSKLRIAVLERGKEYLPGSFPSTTAELPSHMRFHSGGNTEAKGILEGLYDFRVNGAATTIMANGLGGGSLINAGVMIRPPKEAFKRGWPEAINDASKLDEWYEKARHALLMRSDLSGAQVGTFNAEHGIRKQQQLVRLSAGSKSASFIAADVTVSALDDDENSAGVKLPACLKCGDCATGCNVGAKNSLDSNLLVIAARGGVEIYTGTTVANIKPVADELDGEWQLELAHTNRRLRKRMAQPVTVRTNKLILAAGSFGSSELLLRMAKQSPECFPAAHNIGKRFSTNGDMIAAGYPNKRSESAKALVNAVAEQRQPLDRRNNLGPTITGSIELDSKQGRWPELMIQEMACPAPLGRLFQEVVTTASAIHSVSQVDLGRHKKGAPAVDPLSVDPVKISQTNIYAVFGDDGAVGALELPDITHSSVPGYSEGSLTVAVGSFDGVELFKQQIDALQSLSDEAGLYQTILPNPFWSPVPTDLSYLTNNKTGPLLSVHPLGGCAMADSADSGVVNHLGQVFDATGQPYDSLVVLDGAIVPSALGANPALTITALAIRATTTLREHWGYLEPTIGEPENAPMPLAGNHRPRYCEIPNISAASRQAITPEGPLYEGPEKSAQSSKERLNKSTETEAFGDTTFAFTERLAGKVILHVGERNANRAGDTFYVQLSMNFFDSTLQRIIGAEANGDKKHRQLQVNPATSWLRLFTEAEWGLAEKLTSKGSDYEAALDELCSVKLPVEGAMTLFHREPSLGVVRTAKAIMAWLPNRGIRDTVSALQQWWANRKNKTPSNGPKPPSAFQVIKRRGYNALALASHGGEVRTLQYDLAVLPADPEVSLSDSARVLQQQLLIDPVIRGCKRLTYKRLGNLWEQLEVLPLFKFPGSRVAKPGALEVDFGFMEERGTALLRISEQKDQTTALLDTFSGAAYLLRMLLNAHIWSGPMPPPAPKLPDRTAEQKVDNAFALYPRRLPQKIDGVPMPQRSRHVLGTYPSATSEVSEEAFFVLSRYGENNNLKPPVLLIHGYGASGSTFAHPALPHSLVHHLYVEQQRDVWVLDMRSSAALATGCKGWAMEEMALLDIPLALKAVQEHYEDRRKVDIVAHCIGAAMLSMAILKPQEKSEFGGLFGFKANEGKYEEAKNVLSLPDRVINAVALMQVGPTVIPTPINRLRGYFMRYSYQWMSNNQYYFKPNETPELAEQMFNRFAATMRYEKNDLKRMWPVLPSKSLRYVGLRLRIDALYGRTFRLDQMTDETLLHLDDLFGPLSLGTASQARHFSRFYAVANSEGRNHYVSRQNLQARWKFPTLYLHGGKNEIVDPKNRDRMAGIFSSSFSENQWLEAPDPSIQPLADMGHQDSLIGKSSDSVFRLMGEFFERSAPSDERDSKLTDLSLPSPAVDDPFFARAPHSGPLMGMPFPVQDRQKNYEEKVAVSVGLTPGLTAPDYVCFLAGEVDKKTGAFRFASAVKSLNQCGDEQVALCLAGYPTGPFKGSLWRSVQLPVSFFYNVDGTPRPVAALLIHDDIRELDITDSGENESGGDSSFIDLRHIPSASLSGFKRARKAEWEKIVGAVDDAVHQPVGLSKQAVLIRPDSSSEELEFALGSCRYPRGLMDKLPASASFRRLAGSIDSGEASPTFALLVGDQVYSDATAGIADTDNIDDRYRGAYEAYYRDSDVRRLFRRLPVATMLDDHEIVDNWELPPEKLADSYGDAKYFKNGLPAYIRYQRAADPRLPKNALNLAIDGKPLDLWYSLVVQGFGFFVLDTRSRRSAREGADLEDLSAGSLLDNIGDGNRQLRALEKWLIEQQKSSGDKPKFVASPSMLLPRGKNIGMKPENALHADGWNGYPATLHRVLGFIAHHRINNVVFLSGDEHLGSVTDISLTTPEGQAVVAYSIHTAGLYTPFAFANSSANGFVKSDEFSFTPSTSIPESSGSDVHQYETISNGEYRCEVVAQFIEGDGFTRINLEKSQEGWSLECCFDHPGGYKPRLYRAALGQKNHRWLAIV